MPQAPLHLRQHVPAASEAQSVGPLAEVIGPDSPHVGQSFIRNVNTDIIFKHSGDRKMSHLLSEALNRLSPLVMETWPGLKLRVTATWDPTGAGHHHGSLHYEGRAADMTVSDRDPQKLGQLAALAVDAGFGWSFYEDEKHAHASVRKSW